MKKFLFTLALVLAISSASMAKSSSKKSVSNSHSSSKKNTSHKISVKPIILCDGNGDIVGVIFSNGETEGNTGPGTCVC